MSSPTQYFWYRETLNISKDINTPDTFNLQIGAALFAAWVMIYLCLAKGIASSSKVSPLSLFISFSLRRDWIGRGRKWEQLVEETENLLPF